MCHTVVSNPGPQYDFGSKLYWNSLMFKRVCLLAFAEATCNACSVLESAFWPLLFCCIGLHLFYASATTGPTGRLRCHGQGGVSTPKFAPQETTTEICKKTTVHTSVSLRYGLKPCGCQVVFFMPMPPLKSPGANGLRFHRLDLRNLCWFQCSFSGKNM